ncbi:MAG: hypothetical protein J0J06_00530 [Sphingomonas sp.]|nr:hypothetical protein [Sphingomonas sp.]
MLGIAVMRWNYVEALFKTLVFGAVNPPRPGYRVDTLIAHLGSAELSDSLKAIADNYDEPMRSHMKHCSRMFDSERSHRNHLVHGCQLFGYEEGGDEPHALTEIVSAKGGQLRITQPKVSNDDLESFVSKTEEARKYFTAVLLILWGGKSADGLRELEKPPVRKPIERSYSPLIPAGA